MKKKLLQTFTVTSSTLILPAAGLVPAWLADGDFQVQVKERDRETERQRDRETETGEGKGPILFSGLFFISSRRML